MLTKRRLRIFPLAVRLRITAKSSSSPTGFFVMRPVFLLLIFSVVAHAQVRPPVAREFQITKIAKNFIPSPDYGIGRYAGGSNERWLEIEVEFNAAPEWTDELTLKYYILVNGRLLTGDVTHVNIAAGLNRSVMYVLPVALARFVGNRPLLPNTVQNVAVQIVQGGAVKDESSLARAPAQWFSNLPPVSGFVLNKNETPFAPLYWDRYAQIKTPTH
jgi:hypothetical protein